MKGKTVTNGKVAAADVIVAMIRQRSESGSLVSELELRRQLIEGCRPPLLDPDGDIRPTLAEALHRHDDLHELAAEGGARHFYSSQGMTQGYASMLLQKQGDPARLIAEVVRESCVTYPRPVPLDLFAQPPFDLTRKEIIDCLEQMGCREEYRDIASTTTSASTVFLYSTLHLEPEHASMLAEWFDVGQGENP